MAANSRKHSVDVTVLRKRSRYFVGVAKPDHYNGSLSRACGVVVGGGEYVAREWLVTAGGNECLIDEIEGFVRGFNARKAYFLFPLHIHMQTKGRGFAD